MYDDSDEWEDSETSELKLRGTRRTVKLSSIEIEDERRTISESRVLALMSSISKEGLIHPITVCVRGRMGALYRLCSGAHRFEALRRLKYKKIEVVVLDRKQAKRWVNSENLQRNDLSVLDRSESIVRYARTSLGYISLTKGGAQPHDKGYARLAKELGYDRKIIAEAFVHDRLPAEVKLLIREKGAANKRSLLKAVASCASVEQQQALLNGPPTEPRVSRKRAPSDLDVLAQERLKRLLALWSKSKIAQIFGRQSAEVQKAFLARIG